MLRATSPACAGPARVTSPDVSKSQEEGTGHHTLACLHSGFTSLRRWHRHPLISSRSEGAGSGEVLPESLASTFYHLWEEWSNPS